MKEFQYQIIPQISQDNNDQEVIRCQFIPVDCTDEVILADAENLLSNNLSVFLLDNPDYRRLIEETAILNSKNKTAVALTLPYTWKYLVTREISNGETDIGTLTIVVPIEETSDIRRYLDIIEDFISHFKKGETTNESRKKVRTRKGNPVTTTRKKAKAVNRDSK